MKGFIVVKILEVQNLEWKWKKIQKAGKPRNIVFKNNIYTRESTLPSTLLIQDTKKIVGDPKYKNPGGIKPEDYTPTNIELIKDKGIPIEKLPNDKKGLVGGLKVDKDFFGNPIKGLPDMGAIGID